MKDYLRALEDLNQWILDKWSDPGKLISCMEVQQKIEDLKYDEINRYGISDEQVNKEAELSAIKIEPHGGVSLSEAALTLDMG